VPESKAFPAENFPGDLIERRRSLFVRSSAAEALLERDGAA
jgi:hypothetical protein